MRERISVSLEWLGKLEDLADKVVDPAARELLKEIVEDLYEIDCGND